MSKKRAEPFSDKPNLKDMKITLSLSKSDEKAFQACHKKMTEFLGSLVRKIRKTPGPVVTAHEVTQDPDDMEKGDKVDSSI